MSPLKDQVNEICAQLSQNGEESFFVSVDLEKTTCFVIGSKVGLTWLNTQSSILQQFYRYCAALQTSKNITGENDCDLVTTHAASAKGQIRLEVKGETETWSSSSVTFLAEWPQGLTSNVCRAQDTSIIEKTEACLEPESTQTFSVKIENSEVHYEVTPSSAIDTCSQSSKCPNVKVIAKSEGTESGCVKSNIISTCTTKGHRSSGVDIVTKKRKHGNIEITKSNRSNDGKSSPVALADNDNDKVRVISNTGDITGQSLTRGRPKRNPKPRKYFSMECYVKQENVNQYLMEDMIDDEKEVSRSEVNKGQDQSHDSADNCISLPGAGNNGTCENKCGVVKRSENMEKQPEKSNVDNTSASMCSNSVEFNEYSLGVKGQENQPLADLPIMDSQNDLDNEEMEEKCKLYEDEHVVMEIDNDSQASGGFNIERKIVISGDVCDVRGERDLHGDVEGGKVNNKDCAEINEEDDGVDSDTENYGWKYSKGNNSSKTPASNILDMKMLIKNYINNMRSRAKRSRKRKNGHIPCPTCQLSFTGISGLKHHSKVCQKIKCPRCDLHCESLNDLKKHAETHNGEDLYKCRFCEEQFLLISQLKKHETRHSNRTFSCPLCAKAFFSASFLRYHVRENHKETRFCCVECGQLYSDKFEYNKHISVHNKQNIIPVFTCQKCGKSFQKLHYLRRHNNFFHKSVGERLCTHCLRFFKNQKELDIHTEVHKHDKPNTCSFCRQSFLTKLELNIHIHQEHQQSRMFICEICGFQAESQLSLKHHKYEQEDSMPYVCDTCGKGFTLKHKLKSHMISHQKECSLICEVCGMTFRRESSLRSHKTMHADGNKCQFCPKVFRSSSGLNYHVIRNHASLVNVENYKTKVFQCDTCSTFFPSKSSLSNHQIRHIENRTFKCQVCGKSFKTEEHLARHAANHSNDKKFRCESCDVAFLTKERLTAHNLTEKHKKNAEISESLPAGSLPNQNLTDQSPSQQGSSVERTESSIFLTIPEEMNSVTEHPEEHTIYIIGEDTAGDGEAHYELPGIQYIQEGNQLIPIIDSGSLS